jgi:hypothetical protein
MKYEDIYEQIIRGAAADTIPAWAYQVLDDIASGRRSVPAVRHPLGFVCLPVERRGGYGVCLHLWSAELPPAPAMTTSSVHCHSWELISFVLYGSLHNLMAQIADDGTTATHRVFEVVSRDDVDTVRATPRTVHCTPGDDTFHRAGETYTLPAGVFHSTVIDDGVDVATVALGRESPAYQDLTLGRLDTPTHRVRRQRYDPVETARAALLSSRRIGATYHLT